ncbi:hypothetical protein Tco_0121928 [Tanacetum coccineum]
MLKIDVEPIAPRLLNNRIAHSDYLRHTQEQAMILREIVKQGKSQNSLNNSLDYACNTKKDKIQRTPSSTQKNKVEAHPRTVKSNLKNKNYFVKPKGNANVQHSKLNANSKLLCVKCNGCMLSDNHDLCVLDFINDVNARTKSKSVKKSSKRKVWKPTGKVFTNIGYTWRPTGRTFTIVGNACPLTRITTTAEVPLRKPTALESDTPKPVVTLVYSRKPRKSKTNVPVSKPKIIKSISANKKEPSKSWGSIVSDVPSSSLDECRSSKLFSVKFGNDHVAKILGYGDYQIRNVTISRVYYVEGLGNNLFSVGTYPTDLLSFVSESNSPEFDHIFDIKEQSEEEVRETMTETMEQYMSKTRGDCGSGVTRPTINQDIHFELKGQFLKELRDNTFSGSEHEDANKHIEKVLEIVDLFHIPKVTQDQIMLRAF